MGGLAIKVDPSFTGPSKHRNSRFSLSNYAFNEMIKHRPDLLPQLDLNQIRDKSKSNPVVKIIVCAQAVWFMARKCKYGGDSGGCFAHTYLASERRR